MFRQIGHQKVRPTCTNVFLTKVFVILNAQSIPNRSDGLTDEICLDLALSVSVSTTSLTSDEKIDKIEPFNWKYYVVYYVIFMSHAQARTKI